MYELVRLVDGGIGQGELMAKVKVRRTFREELPGAAVLRDAVAGDLSAFPASRGVLDLDMDVDPGFEHLLNHDRDGFFCAIDKEETLGFAAAHVRSRQWVLSELWVLPQHQGRGAGDALLSRLLLYGQRSRANEFLALVPVESAVQGLLLRHELRPLTPVYMFELPLAVAERVAGALSRLLPGKEVTGELLNRRGQAEVDRIDSLTRHLTREQDHLFWLKDCGYQAAFIRQGERIAAFAYGGRDVVGPVSGTTQEAALAGVGWALNLALNQAIGQTRVPRLVLRIPALFTPAVDALLDSGAKIQATLMLYGRGVKCSFDRCALGKVALP